MMGEGRNSTHIYTRARFQSHKFRVKKKSVEKRKKNNNFFHIIKLFRHFYLMQKYGTVAHKVVY
jgi:hypothetical protein